MFKDIVKVLLGISIIGFTMLLIKINPYITLFLVISMVGIYLYNFQKETLKNSKIEHKQLYTTIKTQNKNASLMEKQLTTIASNLPMPIVLLDRDGSVGLYNEAFETFRETKDNRNLTYRANDFVPGVKKIVSDAFLFEYHLNKELLIKGVEYEAIAIPINENGYFSGSMILFQDISIALEKEHLQKQFIADASHELKTPITAIKGMIEILNRDNFDDEETKTDFLTQIEIEIHRLEAIIQDLLMLSKLSSSQVVLHRELIDVNTCILQSVQSLKQMAIQKGIRIEETLGEVSKLFLDAEKIKTMMNNLILNAITYSDTGTIYLQTYEDEELVYIVVEDEGKGIPEEEFEHIFERFYRVGEDRARTSGGTGLGLSIVKSIIESQDGNLEIESSLGKGSKFIISFNKR